MNDSNGCDGCFMSRDGRWCFLIKKGREKGCPCRTCLIKVMCKHSCEEYQTYIRYLE